jgi:Uma2 family endonuclease
MVSQLKRTYTPEEYLALELEAETRSEYRNGDIVLMTGGTPEHNEISANLLTYLKVALKGKPYHVFMTDQRLWIPSKNLYTYPDVMVIEKPLERQSGRTDTVLNPCFIAEVLSKSTQNYDHGDKFLTYRTIPSFSEYLLIDQYNIRIEHFVKMAEQEWRMTEYTDPSVVLSLSSIAFQVNVGDLYENVDFESIFSDGDHG